MANMSVADRARVWRGLMRRWSRDGVSCAFLKDALYSPQADTGAVADIDTWVDTHSANTAADTVGVNGALSVAMRSALSVEQKSDLLIAVVAMRRGIDYLRSVFGEVD
jgi:hypothetical protein